MASNFVQFTWALGLFWSQLRWCRRALVSISCGARPAPGWARLVGSLLPVCSGGGGGLRSGRGEGVSLELSRWGSCIVLWVDGEKRASPAPGSTATSVIICRSQVPKSLPSSVPWKQAMFIFWMREGREEIESSTCVLCLIFSLPISQNFWKQQQYAFSSCVYYVLWGYHTNRSSIFLTVLMLFIFLTGNIHTTEKWWPSGI